MDFKVATSLVSLRHILYDCKNCFYFAFLARFCSYFLVEKKTVNFFDFAKLFAEMMCLRVQ